MFVIPDSNPTLGQRWHFVVRIVGPTSEVNVGPSSFCSQGRRCSKFKVTKGKLIETSF